MGVRYTLHFEPHHYSCLIAGIFKLYFLLSPYVLFAWAFPGFSLRKPLGYTRSRALPAPHQRTAARNATHRTCRVRPHKSALTAATIFELSDMEMRIADTRSFEDSQIGIPDGICLCIGEPEEPIAYTGGNRPRENADTNNI